MRRTALLIVGFLLLARGAGPSGAWAAEDAPPPLPPPPPEAAGGAPSAPADAPPPPAPPSTTDPAKPAKPAAPADANAMPTQEQIQALFDAGNYPDTLKALARVLPLRGKAAEPYDRIALLTLKAETHIRMKAAAPAVSALDDLAEALEEEPDQAKVRATVQLIKRSKGFVYTPKPVKKTSKAPAPIDITDPAGRKAALAAMYEEDMAKVSAKVKAALDESTLPPLAQAIEAAKGVRELELGATGADAKSKEMVTQLGLRGRELILKTIEKMSKRVDEITKDANQTVKFRIPVTVAGRTTVQERVRRRGLKNGEDRELRDVMTQCPKIAGGAQELVDAVGGRKSEAETIVEMCNDLARRAKKTLEDDYSDF